LRECDANEWSNKTADHCGGTRVDQDRRSNRCATARDQGDQCGAITHQANGEASH
jgi:hypothetical protein